MSRVPTLADVLSLAVVQSLADAKTFARGKAYFHEGAISRLEQSDDAVHARVQGTHRYSVELGVGDDGELTYECDCPVGEDGIFCKHAVAVALSWLENSGEEVFHSDDAERAKPRRKRKTDEEQIGDYVATLSEGALRELLLEAAELGAPVTKRHLTLCGLSRNCAPSSTSAQRSPTNSSLSARLIALSATLSNCWPRLVIPRHKL